jgi:hypothetical protein
MLSKFTRQLIWVPVIHTQADLGSVSESVRQLYTRRIGRQKWKEHIRAVDRTWKGIREKIERLGLDIGKVRLYQDGLPTCGREEEIVRGLAQAGSQNHQILLDLVEKGAKLTGTESSELLMEEYRLARQALTLLDRGETDRLTMLQGEASRIILQKRDSYIAERINGTLQIGETGLIFLGMLHSLGGLLPPDIRVRCLRRLPRLVQRNGPLGDSKQRGSDR